MPDKNDLINARQWFTEDLRIINAFAAVPRETYHDLPVAIDAERKLNIGQLSLWAHVFDHLGIGPGSTVLQVGAVTGYYTAIVAELVGANGRLIAYETLEDLAGWAADRLSHYRQVEMRAGDATQASGLPGLDVVVVCAGVTHVPAPWLGKLSDGGRMMLPFTGTAGWGFMMLLEPKGETFPIQSLRPCGFYGCAGARRDDEAQALTQALSKTRGKLPDLGQYHPDPPPEGADDILYAGDAYWISKA